MEGFYLTNDLPDVLSNEEIKFLISNYSNGDINARSILINHNLKLIITIINKYFRNTNFEYEDLFSCGVIGLIKAIDNFNPNRNIYLSTYAYTCIYNELMMMVRRKRSIGECLSLDSPYTNVGDYDNAIELYNYIEDDSIDLEEDVITKDNLSTIKKFIEDLKENERNVILMYFGFINNREYSQIEIASILNISQSYVSRILKKGIKKLQDKFNKFEGLNNKEIVKVKK